MDSILWNEKAVTLETCDPQKKHFNSDNENEIDNLIDNESEIWSFIS